jgi:hypothetical protein
MSCCGKKRSQFRTATPGVAPSGPVYVGNPHAPAQKATFTYVGSGAGMTVIGPATGIRYVFRGAGARVEVDPRDHPMLANLQLLRQVK